MAIRPITEQMARVIRALITEAVHPYPFSPSLSNIVDVTVPFIEAVRLEARLEEAMKHQHLSYLKELQAAVEEQNKVCLEILKRHKV